MRLAAMGGVAILLLGFFIYLMTQLSSADMALLYGDLDVSDSAQVVQRLDDMNVPYELRNDGRSVLVPSDQVDRLRLTMAQHGVPSGGNLGYELFDDADGFGTTSFVQNLNRLRALEGELARTIATIDAIRHARVHLVMPERELFSRDQQEPRASVFLRLNTAGLSAQQVVAIQHLVSFAVPRLDPGNVAIVDDRGNLLAQNVAGDEDLMRRTSVEEQRHAEENRIRQEIEQMLARSLGSGRVIARVSIDMDFDRVETTSETYDPESQVARSTQFVEEEGESTEGDGVDPVTVAGNLPEADDLGALGGPTSADRTSRTEETTNFEISRTVESRLRDGGSIRRLSVAVMVDGIYSANEAGDTVYEPRSQDEMDQIATLVRSAVGFDANRGDTVEVVNMRFLLPEELEGEMAADGFLGMGTPDIMRIAELLILAVVAVLVILLVVRPLLNRALEGTAGAGDAQDDLTALIGGDHGGLQAALAGPVQIGGTPELPPPGGTDPDVEQLIDISQVEGRVKASSIKKIGEIVDAHPEEAVSIIRNWLYQD